jgi:hypothetical protein
VILNGIIRSVHKKKIKPSNQAFSYFCPFVAVFFMRFKNYLFFLIAPRIFIYFWVKMIVPPLSALFA